MAAKSDRGEEFATLAEQFRKDGDAYNQLMQETWASLPPREPKLPDTNKATEDSLLFDGTDSSTLATSQSSPSSQREPLPVRSNMPHHSAEEEHQEKRGDITDQVAKQSKDSSASDHALHTTDKTKNVASVAEHLANPGIVLTDKLPAAASKEELKARAAELNKD